MADRFHVMLIPGFGGFDALGQVEYYADATRLFKAWRGEKPVVLHYFDNFPTAAVVTRAARLRSYLAKRIARGEILEGDEVTLVGHSTGGLDIRQLVSDLHDPACDPVHVDGGLRVPLRTILKHVRRVVFLSVPHWGTNIADWVRFHSVWRKALVAELQAAVAGSQIYLLDRVEEEMAGGAARVTGAELLLAAQDALTEANECFGRPSPLRTADAQEAASELALYLRHMASDFHVINDLSSQAPDRGPKSPAQFSAVERKRELKRFANIEVLSFATVGNRPFCFVPGQPAPFWDLANPCTFREIAFGGKLSAGTDIAYRLCYRACAGGPLRQPPLSSKVSRRLIGSPGGPIELWDNDGIVNTVSMLWPDVENVLVDCDHLDIVGHYRLTKAAPGAGRRYQSYDALKSGSRFSHGKFQKVWTEIFDFCAGTQY
jgi:triacylglycerol lipase